MLTCVEAEGWVLEVLTCVEAEGWVLEAEGG
jgi:hypothetical protein